MLNPWQNKIARLGDFVLLGARLLHSGLFIHEGMTLATNFDAAAVSMAKLGVPAPLLAATTALQLGAGAAVASHWVASQTWRVGVGIILRIDGDAVPHDFRQS
jgi:hypothetical protein